MEKFESRVSTILEDKEVYVVFLEEQGTVEVLGVFMDYDKGAKYADKHRAYLEPASLYK